MPTLSLQITRTNLETESIRMMRSIAADPFRQDRRDDRPEEVRLPFFTLQIGMRGELIATGGGYYDLSDEAFLRELIDLALASGGQTGVISAYNLRFCRVPSRNGHSIVFADISHELSIIETLIQNCLIIGGASFLVFLFISLLLARWAVRPMEQAWAQQRQFVADASHELKTPLTVITTNAELLQSQAYNESSKTEFITNIITMSHQMRRLVEGLLELARVDGGTIKTPCCKVDLSRLTSDAILPFDGVYFEQGLRLSSHINCEIFVWGNEDRLRQAVEILLDNAQKYSAAQGEVMVDLQKKGRTHCLLSVSNPGEAIPQNELHNIFKRFYRIDRARTRTERFGPRAPVAATPFLSILHWLRT